MRGLVFSVAGLLVLASGVWGAHTSRLFETTLPPGAVVDALHVSKTKREMEVFQNGERLAVYAVAIGDGALGPKLREGDRRTPEGSYTIDRRHQSRRFHRFLHVSYPNQEDRERFQAAKLRGAIADTTTLGGAIGIHGMPSWTDWIPFAPRWGWTAGCIAVHNREASDLYEAVRPNATVTVVP